MFAKPKKTIINILFIVSLLSLLVSFVALASVLMWSKSPDVVDKIDQMIPDYYGPKIKRLYKKATRETDDQEKFEFFLKLYHTLEDASTLNKYYAYRQKAARFLITYYLNKDQYKEALEIAAVWEKKYPYDFTGKFEYAKVLGSHSLDDALNYYKKLYQKHGDIFGVLYNYIMVLDKLGYEDEAAKVRLELDSLVVENELEFKIYYKDKQKQFSENQSLLIDQFDDTQSKYDYTFSFQKKFHSFKGLRLDFEKASLLFDITKIEVTVHHAQLEKSLSIQTLHHITQDHNKVYKISGDDPFVEFTIPHELLDKKGNLEFKISIETRKRI